MHFGHVAITLMCWYQFFKQISNKKLLTVFSGTIVTINMARRYGTSQMTH